VIEELRRAYKDGLVDPRSIAWEDIEHSLALGQQAAMQQRHRSPVITDLASDMGWMDCFHKTRKHYEEDSYEELGVMSDGASVMTIRRTTPKVGRNEPCPCGSGKKFKKCCGAS
jgi:preprotein translocase subunit SecA